MSPNRIYPIVYVLTILNSDRQVFLLFRSTHSGVVVVNNHSHGFHPRLSTFSALRADKHVINAAIPGYSAAPCRFINFFRLPTDTNRNTNMSPIHTPINTIACSHHVPCHHVAVA